MGANSEDSMLGRTAGTLKSVQTIVSFAVTLAALVAAGTLGWQSLQEKPTRNEVDTKILQVKTEMADVRRTLDTHGKQLSRVAEIQKYQIMQDAWQSDVLSHISQRRKGDPPKRPEYLQQLGVSLLAAE
jgi:hypothetical protein